MGPYKKRVQAQAQTLKAMPDHPIHSLLKFLSGADRGHLPKISAVDEKGHIYRNCALSVARKGASTKELEEHSEGCLILRSLDDAGTHSEDLLSRDTEPVKLCLVVANISAALVDQLGSFWDIDPDFFAQHLQNPSVEEAWHREGWTDGRSSHPRSQHVKGIYELLSEQTGLLNCYNYDRLVFQDGSWPTSVVTKIPYYAADPYIRLFLIDLPPVENVAPRERHNALSQPAISLRFPYSGNYGGTLLASPRARCCCDLSESLLSVFAHPWTVDSMFGEEQGVVPRAPFVYMLAYSLWEANFRGIDHDIKRISFHDMRRPDHFQIQQLHDLREELSRLRNSISDMSQWMDEKVAAYFRGDSRQAIAMRYIQTVSRRADDLNAFLLETFTLLMNAVALQQSVRASQQALEATLQGLDPGNSALVFTRLAAVYLPLSLSVGIFGMNLSELNQSGQPIWVSIVTSVGIFAATAFALFATNLKRVMMRIAR